MHSGVGEVDLFALVGESVLGHSPMISRPFATGVEGRPPNTNKNIENKVKEELQQSNNKPKKKQQQQRTRTYRDEDRPDLPGS